MRTKRVRIAVALAVLCTALLVSCGNRYKEKPFGGLNGRVQKVTVYHLMPEVWYANFVGTDVMYVNTSIYDVYGNEICSAVMDSAERVQVETESLFEDGVCTRSTQKSGGRTIAQTNLVSNNKGTLEYNKELNGRLSRMTVKQTSFGRKHKSVVTENGVVTTISVIQTDRQGYPVKITITEPQRGVKTVETNKFDENHNVIEKHVITHKEGKDKDEESITFTEYGDVDDHGNWKDCRTFNEFRLPLEVLVREFEYWE
ncbi:MAG: hypothetical protein MJY68_10355 [Bacteroidaceae bacterium]|nr:hypothetical protein [Bacteroidaceae bacterium]